MRAHRNFRVLLVIIAGVVLAAMASPAVAQPKKKPAKGAKAPKPAATPAPTPTPTPPAKDAGGEIEMEPDDGSKKPDAAVNPEEIEMGDEKPADLNADLNASAQSTDALKVGVVKKTPLSWQDIVVVIRKPFLKQRRVELLPFVGTSMNDNMVRHYTLGGELAYYLTDVLAVGVEGIYYAHSFREPFDLVARQARRLPTINQYNWSAALNFHYVPVYGKFAILDHSLVAWEAFFTAGIGAGQSEVVPRDTKFPGFSNILIMPNVGASMRFFVAKWMTVTLGIRDYVFLDKFEPENRTLMMNATAAEAKDNADTALINNVMFQIGISFWLPTSFEYTTFR